MASIRYFIGMSQVALEAGLAQARSDLMNGSTLQSGGATDSTFGYMVHMPPQRRIELFLEELSILDPVTYPPAQVNPTRVLIGQFRDR